MNFHVLPGKGWLLAALGVLPAAAVALRVTGTGGNSAVIPVMLGGIAVGVVLAYVVMWRQPRGATPADRPAIGQMWHAEALPAREAKAIPPVTVVNDFGGLAATFAALVQAAQQPAIVQPETKEITR